MSEERLQKVIAQAGVSSRRGAETLITEGRVRVNGRVVTTLGAKADPQKDRIDVDGKRVVAERPAYYLLHKPRGVVTTLDDPEGRETIARLVKGIPERVFPVGRLDYHTSGVLLITNDGAMSQALLHPKRTVPKTYVAKVRGQIDVEQLDVLRHGVALGGGDVSRKAEVFVLREDRNNTWLQITITEGKNRQIHRMVEAVGCRVSRLARVAFAGLTVEGLRPGEYRELRGSELQKLKRDYLNPQKRAIAAAVRKEALEAAMVALGYNPGPDNDAIPGPIIHRKVRPSVPQGAMPNGSGNGHASGSAAGPRPPSPGPRVKPRKDGSQPSSSYRQLPGGSRVEVMTVRRRPSSPPGPSAPETQASQPPPQASVSTGPGHESSPEETQQALASQQSPRRRRVIRKVDVSEDPSAGLKPNKGSRRRKSD